MGKGVETRRGGQAPRQSERQFRIADGALGEQVRADDAELGAVAEGDQRRSADLRAGAGGGGHGNDRRDGVGDARDAAADRGIVGERQRMRGQQGDRLRQVDRRAASQRDDAVAAGRPVEVERLEDGGFGGVGRNAGEDRRVGRAERPDAVDHAELDEAGIADEERPDDPQLGQRGRDLGDHAGPEFDAGYVVDCTHEALTLRRDRPAGCRRARRCRAGSRRVFLCSAIRVPAPVCRGRCQCCSPCFRA